MTNLVQCLLLTLTIVTGSIHSVGPPPTLSAWSVMCMICRVPSEHRRRPTALPEHAWEDVAHLMDSGDLLLVRTHSVVARAVQAIGQCWYNHVAVLVRDPPAIVLAAYGVTPAPFYVLESDVPGARLVTLTEWREKYRDPKYGRTVCVWRRVLVPTRDRCASALVRLAELHYPSLLQTLWRRLGWLPPITDCANCVDVACEVLRGLGALDADARTTRLWTPDNLSDERWQGQHVWREIALPVGHCNKHTTGMPEGHQVSFFCDCIVHNIGRCSPVHILVGDFAIRPDDTGGGRKKKKGAFAPNGN